MQNSILNASEAWLLTNKNQKELDKILQIISEIVEKAARQSNTQTEIVLNNHNISYQKLFSALIKLGYTICNNKLGFSISWKPLPQY